MRNTKYFAKPGWVDDTSASSVANRIPDKNRDAAKWPIEFMQQKSVTQQAMIAMQPVT